MNDLMPINIIYIVRSCRRNAPGESECLVHVDVGRGLDEVDGGGGGEVYTCYSVTKLAI